MVNKSKAPDFSWDRTLLKLKEINEKMGGQLSVDMRHKLRLMEAVDPYIDDREDMVNVIKAGSLFLVEGIHLLEEYLKWSDQISENQSNEDTEPMLLVYVHDKDIKEVQEIMGNTFEEIMLEFIAIASDGDESETGKWVKTFSTCKFSFQLEPFPETISYEEFFRVMKEYEKTGEIPK